ncbi:hypothetical protein GCM10022408_11270 [Hymenobacter fastidiosus]|uniref:DUF3784 domain-containing protein n=1 Tax=Hymenobacter fastidiosus TaxID=486264 RepID=A0ABP7RSP5_9BACT
MKGFLLLLFCLTAWGAQAQSTPVLTPDYSTFQYIAKSVFLPVFGLFLLCNFVLAAIKLVLNYLLKKQIVVAATSESIVERLLPGPQDEQNKVVKWVALLLSIGGGLTISSWYLPWGLHSVIILIFSIALGFLAYYLFLRRQTK